MMLSTFVFNLTNDFLTFFTKENIVELKKREWVVVGEENIREDLP